MNPKRFHHPGYDKKSSSERDTSFCGHNDTSGSVEILHWYAVRSRQSRECGLVCRRRVDRDDFEYSYIIRKKNTKMQNFALEFRVFVINTKTYYSNLVYTRYMSTCFSEVFSEISRLQPPSWRFRSARQHT